MIEMGDHEGAQRLLANLQVYSYPREYISRFVLFYPDFYHNLLPSSGHDPVWEQAAAGPQQEAHPHHERAAGVQTGRRHQLSQGLHQRLEAQQVQCIVMCRNVKGPS